MFGLVALVMCVGLGLYGRLFEERRGYFAMASVGGVTGVGIAAAVMRERRDGSPTRGAARWRSSPPGGAREIASLNSGSSNQPWV